MSLESQIKALLDLDSRNALVPHGVGGFGRELLTQALLELKCKDALISDHLRKIMHLENRIEEEHAEVKRLRKFEPGG